MKTVFPSMPKGEIVGNMEIHVGIDGIGIENRFVTMIVELMELALKILNLLHNHDWNRDTNVAYISNVLTCNGYVY